MGGGDKKARRLSHAGLAGRSRFRLASRLFSFQIRRATFAFFNFIRLLAHKRSLHPQVICILVEGLWLLPLKDSTPICSF